MISALKDKTFQLVFLLVCTALLFLGRQLDVGLPNFDDAYYAQKAKEMAASGNLWIVTHNGEPDFANPPFPFWMTALAFKLFGVSGYAAVFFPALFGLATVLLTYALCLNLYKDTWTAFFAAFVLIFPGMFADAARRAMVDVTLAFCVTAAMYFFVKAERDKWFYLLYGLMTALAILTKSVLGLFPLMVGGAVLILGRRFKEIGHPCFLMGTALALGLGFSWHAVNGAVHGAAFYDMHFGVLIFNRGFESAAPPFYFLGYAQDFLKNYWPWLPLALIGLWQCGRRAIGGRDFPSLVLLVWIVLVYLVMSTSTNQTLRYLFMIFPPLAIVIARTLADWLSESLREKLLPWMAGVVVLTVVFVNATPFQVKVTLSPNSVDVRQLAAVIHLNTPPEQRIGNFRLSAHNPRQAMLFYADRFLGEPVTQSDVMLARLEQASPATWLTSVEAFRQLEQEHPGQLYLIQATRKYAYFTSMARRDRVRYDFSGMARPRVR